MKKVFKLDFMGKELIVETGQLAKHSLVWTEIRAATVLKQLI